MTWIILSTYLLLLLLLILLIREKRMHAETKAELKRDKLFSEMMEERITELEGEYNKLLESWGGEKV